MKKIEAFIKSHQVDEMVEAVVATVQRSAHTGLRSDGKIYVLPVEQAVRISTGETGPEAI